MKLVNEYNNQQEKLEEVKEENKVCLKCGKVHHENEECQVPLYKKRDKATEMGIIIIVIVAAIGVFLITSSFLNNRITNIVLKTDNLMPLNSTRKIEVETSPIDAKEKIVWSSSNEKVATIDDGIIKAVGVGRTIIIARSKNDVSGEILIEVYKPAESITIDKKSIELKVGATDKINAIVTPDDIEVMWESSNDYIAKVDEYGVVTGISEGTATITVRDKGSNKQECIVKVIEKTAEEIEQEKQAERKAFIDSCKSYSYKEIFRNSEDYYGKNAKFTGKVVQVLEGSSIYQIRMNVTRGSYGFYSDTIMAFIPKNAIKGRILEDDIITIYGNLGNLYSYETVLGSTMTIPRIDVLYANLVR